MRDDPDPADSAPPTARRSEGVAIDDQAVGATPTSDASPAGRVRAFGAGVAAWWAHAYAWLDALLRGAWRFVVRYPIAGAVAAFVVAWFVLPWAWNWLVGYVDPQSADDRTNLAQAVAQALGAIFLGLGLVFTARTLRVNQRTLAVNQNTLALAEQGQVSERFTRAIEQLGSDRLELRLGAIHALERVAADSPRDRPAVVDILATFVREHRPVPPERRRRWEASTGVVMKLAGGGIAFVPMPSEYDAGPTPSEYDAGPWRAPADVQAALTALLRRIPLAHEETAALDFSNTDLSLANLDRANLAGAALMRADLARAFLEHAHLDRAFLSGAHLWQTQLDGASLRWASLSAVQGESARFSWADLTEASCHLARLTGALLVDTRLDGALLVNANLDRAWCEGASLRDADLRGTSLVGTILVGADLSQANLRDLTFDGTDLADANLTGADLCGADLRLAKNLTREQVAAARTNDKTQLPDELRDEASATPPDDAGPATDA